MFGSTFTPSGPAFQSGTYVPVLTAVSNISGLILSGGGYWIYVRIGNVVFVSGQISVQCTVVGTGQFTASIPVPSNFSTNSDANGNLTSPNGADYIGSVYGGTGNVNMLVYANAASNGYRFLFMYVVR